MVLKSKMNLAFTGEINNTVVENKFLLKNVHSLIKRYGRDVFSYLHVFKLVAAEKIDIYQADVHKKIILKSLFSQLYNSLCRPISEEGETNKKSQSFDKMSIQETIHIAMKTDNIF